MPYECLYCYTSLENCFLVSSAQNKRIWKFLKIFHFFSIFSIFCFFLQKYPQMRFFKIYPNFVKSQNVKVLSYKYDIGTYWYLMFVNFLMAHVRLSHNKYMHPKGTRKKIIFSKISLKTEKCGFFENFLTRNSNFYVPVCAHTF